MAAQWLNPKETAVQIRRLLKAHFPTCKFSVTTARGSMVSSVDVRWTDGPTGKAVDKLIGFFEAGHFDGMTDSYEYHQDRDIIIDGTHYRAGCRYVHTHRTVSAALANRCIAQVAEYWGGVETIPVAVDSSLGYKLEGGVGNHHIRPDVDIDWYTAIYRAASNRTEYARGVDTIYSLEG